ncbi:NAD(P)-binding domain-containing protein [Spirosoma aerolatum]|uniref:NAD(P)-binding domain-containing protein n=1 Tax=Spirosoma aerolatum TaxID=1211326 RepID=UPI0009AC9F0F|nr:NAD(P)-binding domain-containing protein [Spirosoma aerolatum]
MKPTIAIIGLGSTGSTFAVRLAEQLYRLLLFDQDRSKAQMLVESLLQKSTSTDIEAIDCKVTACWEADVLVLAVPESAKKAVAEQIKQVATCKLVINLATLARPDHPAHTHAGEELQQWLPNSKLVHVWIAPSENGTLPDTAFITGQHEEAIATVADLLTVARLTPIVVEDWSV